MSYNLIKPRDEARQDKRNIIAKDIQILLNIYLGSAKNIELVRITGQKKDRISSRCQKLEHEGVLLIKDNGYILTEEGLDLLNHIIGYYNYLVLASQI